MPVFDRSKFVAFAATVATLVATGCSRSGPGFSPDPTPVVFEPVSLAVPPDEEAPPLSLGPGDQVRIQVLDEPESWALVRIGIDGRLHYGPGPGIDAEGMTVAEISEALEAKLSEYYVQPQVEVLPVEILSRQATVLGQVRQPGNVALDGGERIFDLLAESGGFWVTIGSLHFKQLADLSSAIYVRDGEVLPVDFEALFRDGDIRHNIRVHPGDYLYIPAVFHREVTVLGDVNSPNVVDMSERLTIAQAVAFADGCEEGAYGSSTLLIRGSMSRPRVARVDLPAILNGRHPDIPLENGDIIYVPGPTSESPERLIDHFNKSFVTQVSEQFATRLYREVFGDGD